MNVSRLRLVALSQEWNVYLLYGNCGNSFSITRRSTPFRPTRPFCGLLSGRAHLVILMVKADGLAALGAKEPTGSRIQLPVYTLPSYLSRIARAQWTTIKHDVDTYVSTYLDAFRHSWTAPMLLRRYIHLYMCLRPQAKPCEG
jgi:hypothetical protein